MNPIDSLFQRFMIGIFVLFIVFGAYAYFERGRTLECRTQAQTTGMSAVDAVALCKK